MSDASTQHEKLQFGTTVFDDEGRELGTIRGFDEHGFYVTTDEGIGGMSIEHLRAGHEFGEAELMWRCWQCGKLEKLDEALPETCPDCGAPKEDLYFYTED